MYIKEKKRKIKCGDKRKFHCAKDSEEYIKKQKKEEYLRVRVIPAVFCLNTCQCKCKNYALTNNFLCLGDLPTLVRNLLLNWGSQTSLLVWVYPNKCDKEQMVSKCMTPILGLRSDTKKPSETRALDGEAVN